MEPIADQEQVKNQLGIRRLILAIIVSIMLLIAWAIWAQVHNRLTTGRIIITTSNKSNRVSILQTADSVTGSKTKEKLVNGSQTIQSGQAITLQPGTYIVTVENGNVAAAQTINLKKDQTASYSINLPKSLVALEPVADVDTTQFVIGSSQIFYVDSRTKGLYSINQNNGLSLVNNRALAGAQWADASFGVAEDPVGTLYAINNGNLAVLNNVPANSAKSLPVYAVAPNHDIYLGIGKNIYLQTANSGFKQIYTTDSSTYSLLATNGHVAVLNGSDSGQETSSQTPIIIVNNDGSIIKKSIDEDDPAWSPNGKFLAITSESQSQIFDSSLNLIATVPNINANTVRWLDNNTLFYAEGVQLWEYNLTSGLAKVVGVVPNSQSIVGIELGNNSSYVYLAVQISNHEGDYFNLYRYSLTNQAAPSFVTQISPNLPWLTQGCFLSLVNFTAPTIEVFQSQPYDGCIPIAQSYVKQLGIDSGKFGYQLSNVLPPTP